MKHVLVSGLLLIILCWTQTVEAQNDAVPKVETSTQTDQAATDPAAEQELKEVTVPKRTGLFQYGGRTISSLLRDKEIPFLGGRWGGEVMIDAPLNHEPEGAALTLRRAKLRYVRGFGDNWQIKFTGNYTKGGGLELDDNYVIYAGWKTALLKFGILDPPYSLESASNSSAITFMERSLATDALSERQSGGLTFLKRTQDHILNGMLVFLNPKDDDLRQRGQAAIVHYVYSPIEMAGKDNIHIGGSFSYRVNTDGSSTQFRSRPESAVADDYFVDTGAIDGADKILRAAFEASRVNGRFSWQTETFTTRVTRENADKVAFWGGYVYASWFLTDDSRNYDFGDGSFVDVVPNSPMFSGGWANRSWAGGWGAFELAGRLSYVDLTSRDIIGGKETNATVGLNWYLSQDIRVMTNLVKVLKINNPGSQYHNQEPFIFSVRAQMVIK